MAMAMAACTPPPDSRVAAAYLNGQVEILAYVCDGDQVSVVQVFEVDEGGDGSGWEVGPRQGTDYAENEHLLRFPVFDAPDNWDMLDDTLSSLEPGTRYGFLHCAGSGL
jgi:hypothetical protein